MRKKYITPEIEVLYFDTEDVICTSGAPGETDTPDTLTTIGVDTGDTAYTDLTK